MTKRPVTGKWKTKAVISKSLHNSLDIFMLILLAKFEFDRWFHIFKNKELTKKIGFPLKSDDIIVMSSNVHEWKGKPRFIV